MTDIACQSCGPRRPATHLVDFGDTGPIFEMCELCASEGKRNGALLQPIEPEDRVACFTCANTGSIPIGVNMFDSQVITAPCGCGA